MSEKLKSRKLWVALLVPILVTVNELFDFGLDEGTITAVVSAAVAYVLGQGVVDAADVYSFNKGQAEVTVKSIDKAPAGPINPD